MIDPGIKKEKFNLREWLYSRRYGFILFALIYAMIGFEIFRLIFGMKISQYLIFLFLVTSGVNLMGNRKVRFYLTLGAGILILIPELIGMIWDLNHFFKIESFLALSLFFIFISIELFKQVLSEKVIDFKTIIGAFTGYFLIGVISFFTYSWVQIIYPGSFSLPINSIQDDFSDLFYFSFVSLTTIGFGDILPVLPLAKRLVIFFGLFGQFYLAVIVATLVGKFITHSKE